MTAPMLSPVIENADRTLRTLGEPESWPEGRDARHRIAWAADSLAAALDAHARLLGSGVTGQFQDEAEALEEAERQVAECTLALERAHREGRVREGALTVLAARQMTERLGV